LLRGTFEHPNLSLDAIVDGVRIGETVFGQVESRFSFFEHALNMFVSYRYNPLDAGLPPDMLFSGTLPYELPLGEGHTHKPGGTIDMTLQSKGVRLDLFGPFIPVVSNLTGFLTCDLKIKGSADSPDYSGFMSLSSAQFLFKPLNIQYILDGRFVSEGKNIALHEVTLKNIPQEYRGGVLKISGNFTLDGLSMGAFDLSANGQLRVMRETARLQRAFFGAVAISTGAKNLTWNGKPSKSYLSGEVILEEARLTFPPDIETITLDTRNIAMIFRDDTSKVKPDDVTVLQKNNNGSSSFMVGSTSPFAANREPTIATLMPSRSLWPRLASSDKLKAICSRILLNSPIEDSTTSVLQKKCHTVKEKQTK